MKYIPQGFVSTILAQKKLTGNGNSNNGDSGISDSYDFNPRLSNKPSFYTPSSNEERDYGLPISDIINTLARKAKSVYESYLISEDGQELLAKADEFGIFYDIQNIDFIDLRDKVEEFEDTIARANEYGIDWESFGYDQIGIEQEIAEAEIHDSYQLNYARRQFSLSLGAEA